MDHQKRIERINELNSMDAFQRAREKHESRKKPKDNPAAVAQVVPVEPVPEISRPVEPKGKQDATIQVKVSLPDREITFTLTKQNVYGNVSKVKLTEAELKKAVRSGLETLMGSIK